MRHSDFSRFYAVGDKEETDFEISNLLTATYLAVPFEGHCAQFGMIEGTVLQQVSLTL